MTLYVDTSVLVAALTREVETERMLAWLGAQDPSRLSISDWVVTEFSSALSIKVRTGQIGLTHRANALAMFTTLTTETIARLPISGAQFRAAARFADQHALNLRSGDALHLAICADHGAILCTLDRRLAEAGPALAVKTTLL